MVPHLVRLLSVVFLSLVSTSSFGVHTDYFFKSEAEARGASVWECGYVDAGLWNPIRGGAMPMKVCMAVAKDKVFELGATYSAKTPPGTRYCLPPPVRDDKCSNGPLTTAPDPVTGLPVWVYALSCYERQTLQCLETYAGGVGIAGGAQMVAGVTGIKGHPDPYKAASVLLLAVAPPPIADECPDVPALSPYGPPDPPALDMKNLSEKALKAASCLSTCSGITNQSELFASGYRPVDYNIHLAEIWKKWDDIWDDNSQACVQRWVDIKRELDLHQLGGSSVPIPDNYQCHSAGTCFDVNSKYISEVDRCSSLCEIRRTLPEKDKGHTVPY